MVLSEIQLPKELALQTIPTLIGFGRASDIASLGAWMYKAIQNDLLVVCYGVNDIMQGASAERVKGDLLTTVNYLLKQGKRVILQTVPPFNYNEEQKTRWLEVNRYIKDELAQKVELVFDVVPYLCLDSDHPEIAKFGGDISDFVPEVVLNDIEKRIKNRKEQ